MGYDGRPLLLGVGLALMAGECVVLKGGNGTGKTTLVRGIAGLAPLLSGTVRINGVDPKEDRASASAGMVHLGHRDALAAELTVMESLGLWARSRGLAPAPADLDAAVDRFGLGAMAGSPVRSLSAGQKRRAALLRLAFMAGTGRSGATPLWLLDEPATALDADSTACLAEVVEDHLEAGGAALITAHRDFPVEGSMQVELSGLNQAEGVGG